MVVSPITLPGYTQLYHIKQNDMEPKLSPQYIILPVSSLEELQELVRLTVKQTIEEQFQQLNHDGKKEDDDLLKMEDLCRLFKVSKVTIHEWRKKGLLPKPIRKNSRVYFLKSEIVGGFKEVGNKRKL